MPRSQKTYRSIAKPQPVRPAPVPSTASAPAAPVQHQHNVVVEKQGFFSNVWQGFGLGAGQAIAHNIFRSDPAAAVKHVEVAKPTAANTTTDLPREFVQCMKDNNNDTDLCKQFLSNAEKN
jgi:hypothetical protein